jgi:hypothetical protein
MGIVFKAYDTKLSRVVAVKVLAPELAANATARKRFLREARAAAAVSHDHVVTIHAVEENEPPKGSRPATRGGLPYLVMEFIDGESLEQKIDREGHLELKEILRIGRQVAAGLEAAHEQGLVHRDIKPSNILLENGVERVQITDFGLARATDDVSITRTGDVAGTPQYMSPEQAQAKPVDTRSDLFSLGSVLYAMCTGRSPFRADTTMASLKRVCEDTPRPIREINPDVPKWLVAITDRLLEKEPEDRFQTAEKVCELLGECLAHVQDPTVNALPDSLPAPGAPKRRRPSPKSAAAALRRSRWAVAAAVLIGVIALVTLSEATGFTNLAATVIRIATGEGTLVIEIDDPTVQVSLDGEELSITGAGIQELRLRPGQYQFQAKIDGQPVKTELISITRGGRQVVRVTRERTGLYPPGEGAIERPAVPGAFVVLRADGAEVGKFDSLAEAVVGSGAGDTIEIRGNGPFITDPTVISHSLTIRAGDGFRPVIRENPEDPRTADGPWGRVLDARSALVLEGLELQNLTRADKNNVILNSCAPLHVVNCRFLLSQHGQCINSTDSGLLRNCELISADNLSTLFWWTLPSGGHFAIENCVHVGKIMYHYLGDSDDSSLRLSANTMKGWACALGLLVSQRSDAHPEHPLFKPAVRIVASGNAIDSFVLLQSLQSATLERRISNAEAQALLPRLIKWHEVGNLYGSLYAFLFFSQQDSTETTEAITVEDWEDWSRFWGLEDTGSTQGVIRLQGGDLLAKAQTHPEQITAEDFRLRPDSSGYKAGPDGKDLGADIDLVGPGEAYERWKQTPEYRVWQKETRELMKTAVADQPEAEAGAFVILATNGAEVGKFDSLAEAVVGSSAGDTIEIRGNGPFITDPTVVRHPLTIRAAAGFRPVIRGNPMTPPSFKSPLLTATTPLMLEGLELQFISAGHTLVKSIAPLHAANCRFFFFVKPVLARNFIYSNSSGLLRNCEFISNFAGIFLCDPLDVSFVIENCVVVAPIHTGIEKYVPFTDDINVSLRLSRNTTMSPVPPFGLSVLRPPESPPKDPGYKPVRVFASGNIVDSPGAIFGLNHTPEMERPEALLPRLLQWREAGNLYLSRGGFLLFNRMTPEKPDLTIWSQDLEDWNRFWGLTDTGSSQGVIRYQGGDVRTKARTNPGQLTADDFRLRPDSAGYKAGPDGKDLGADIDLVGPGEAYERWKQTPEYQEWQKETRELMKAALAESQGAEAASETETGEESPAADSEEDQPPVEDSAEEQPATSDS